jgi:hypothetical protein
MSLLAHRTKPSIPRARWTGGILFACLLAFLGHVSAARSATDPTASAPLRETKITFAELGAGPIELHGIKTRGTVNVGARIDEVIVGAKLRLRLTYSPALLPDLSHLRVHMNDQLLATLPLPREQAGRENEREIALDPRYFTDYNQLRFELIGHYTLECEDPQHSSIWAVISPQSELELTIRPLELRNDLALLPAPFFDRRDNRRLVLPIVLPRAASREIVRSAGVIASWFGALADYRSARFPVSFDEAPLRHALVFATNAARPAGLPLDEVSKPTVSIVDHPLDPYVKLLVFQGKDEAQLRAAVEGLVLGNPVLTGSTATIEAVEYERRKAYDVPRWLRSDRPVKLGELVEFQEQLQSSGFAPEPIHVNLRLPPDLFTWNRSGVPVELRYRYTVPHEGDNSMLSISINNQLLRSYRLRSEAERTLGDRLLVPLLQEPTAQQADDFVIPAFQLASNNVMEFQFAMELHRRGMCTTVFTGTPRQALDPDSTIDISKFPHYAAMPNLALFANAGYPFTRYADLGETAIVLSDIASPENLEQLFFVLGRMGRHTGAVAAAYRLLDTDEALKFGNLDLLILSVGTDRLLETWSKNRLLQLRSRNRALRDAAAAQHFGNYDLLAKPDRRSTDTRVQVEADGSLGAIISFESPLRSGRTVVALIGTDTHAQAALADVLEDAGKVSRVRGDLTIVRGGNVESYQGESVYYVGSLSWWKRLWFHLSRHSILLTLVTLAVAAVVALWVYGWLQRRAKQRLKAEGE